MPSIQRQVVAKEDVVDGIRPRPCPNCHTVNAPTFDHCTSVVTLPQKAVLGQK